MDPAGCCPVTFLARAARFQRAILEQIRERGLGSRLSSSA